MANRQRFIAGVAPRRLRGERADIFFITANPNMKVEVSDYTVENIRMAIKTQLTWHADDYLRLVRSKYAAPDAGPPMPVSRNVGGVDQSVTVLDPVAVEIGPNNGRLHFHFAIRVTSTGYPVIRLNASRPQNFVDDQGEPLWEDDAPGVMEFLQDADVMRDLGLSYVGDTDTRRNWYMYCRRVPDSVATLGEYMDKATLDALQDGTLTAHSQALRDIATAAKDATTAHTRQRMNVSNLLS